MSNRKELAGELAASRTWSFLHFLYVSRPSLKRARTDSLIFPSHIPSLETFLRPSRPTNNLTGESTTTKLENISRNYADTCTALRKSLPRAVGSKKAGGGGGKKR